MTKVLHVKLTALASALLICFGGGLLFRDCHPPNHAMPFRSKGDSLLVSSIRASQSLAVSDLGVILVSPNSSHEHLSINQSIAPLEGSTLGVMKLRDKSCTCLEITESARFSMEPTELSWRLEKATSDTPFQYEANYSDETGESHFTARLVGLFASDLAILSSDGVDTLVSDGIDLKGEDPNAFTAGPRLLMRFYADGYDDATKRAKAISFESSGDEYETRIDNIGVRYFAGFGVAEAMVSWSIRQTENASQGDPSKLEIPLRFYTEVALHFEDTNRSIPIRFNPDRVAWELPKYIVLSRNSDLFNKYEFSCGLREDQSKISLISGRFLAAKSVESSEGKKRLCVHVECKLPPEAIVPVRSELTIAIEDLRWTVPVFIY